MLTRFKNRSIFTCRIAITCLYQEDIMGWVHYRSWCRRKWHFHYIGSWYLKRNSFYLNIKACYSHLTKDRPLCRIELFSHSTLHMPSNTNWVTHTNATCSGVQQATLNCPSSKGNREEREGQNSWLMASVLNFLLILNAVNLQIYLAETEGSC